MFRPGLSSRALCLGEFEQRGLNAEGLVLSLFNTIEEPNTARNESLSYHAVVDYGDL